MGSPEAWWVSHREAMSEMDGKNFMVGVDCAIHRAVITDLDKYGEVLRESGENGTRGYASVPDRGATKVCARKARQTTGREPQINGGLSSEKTGLSGINE